MQFLWFYIPGPDNGMELRYSIRSVIQNFQGEAKITVIGDRPNWFTGHHIPCPKQRNRSRGDRDAFLDTQRKIVVASTHPEIEDEFVWLADDNFLLKPVTIEDLKIVRYDPWWKKRSQKLWHRLITETFNALKEHGKPNMQTGTHLPHVCSKQKLVDLFKIYRYPERLLLWEILNSNHYGSDFLPYGGCWNNVEYPQFLRRILNRPKKISDLNATTSGASVLNYQSSCYGKIMKEFLESKFPTKTEFE